MDTELIKGTLSLIILTLLKRKPMYGYEILMTVKNETDSAFEWKAGSLYPSLHKLEKDGLVCAEWQGTPGSRRRKFYNITKAGEKILSGKIDSWQQISVSINKILEKSDE